MNSWHTRNGYKIVQVLAGRSNVFLITNGTFNILVDTSVGMMWNLLQRQLRKLHISHIQYLILTHSHFDHAANASSIREKYRSQVIIHKSEAELLRTGRQLLPGGTGILTNLLMKPAGYIARWIKNRPCPHDILVDSSFDFDNTGLNIQIMHTPGHSPGSISVIIDNEIALVGDCMIGSWGIFPPFAEDVPELLNSWRRLLDNTNCQLFIPSHGTENSREQVEKEFNKRIMKSGKNLEYSNLGK